MAEFGFVVVYKNEEFEEMEEKLGSVISNAEFNEMATEIEEEREEKFGVAEEEQRGEMEAKSDDEMVEKNEEIEETSQFVSYMNQTEKEVAIETEEEGEEKVEVPKEELKEENGMEVQKNEEMEKTTEVGSEKETATKDEEEREEERMFVEERTRGVEEDMKVEKIEEMEESQKIDDDLEQNEKSLEQSIEEKWEEEKTIDENAEDFLEDVGEEVLKNIALFQCPFLGVLEEQEKEERPNVEEAEDIEMIKKANGEWSAQIQEERTSVEEEEKETTEKYVDEGIKNIEECASEKHLEAFRELVKNEKIAASKEEDKKVEKIEETEEMEESQKIDDDLEQNEKSLEQSIEENWEEEKTIGEETEDFLKDVAEEVLENIDPFECPFLGVLEEQEKEERSNVEEDEDVGMIKKANGEGSAQIREEKTSVEEEEKETTKKYVDEGIKNIVECASEKHLEALRGLVKNEKIAASKLLEENKGVVSEEMEESQKIDNDLEQNEKSLEQRLEEEWGAQEIIDEEAEEFLENVGGDVLKNVDLFECPFPGVLEEQEKREQSNVEEEDKEITHKDGFSDAYYKKKVTSKKIRGVIVKHSGKTVEVVGRTRGEVFTDLRLGGTSIIAEPTNEEDDVDEGIKNIMEWFTENHLEAPRELEKNEKIAASKFVQETETQCKKKQTKQKDNIDSQNTAVVSKEIKRVKKKTITENKDEGFKNNCIPKEQDVSKKVKIVQETTISENCPRICMMVVMFLFFWFLFFYGFNQTEETYLELPLLSFLSRLLLKDIPQMLF